MIKQLGPRRMTVLKPRSGHNGELIGKQYSQDLNE
jgi:hypothetical protein